MWWNDCNNKFNALKYVFEKHLAKLKREMTFLILQQVLKTFQFSYKFRRKPIYFTPYFIQGGPKKHWNNQNCV